MRHTRDQFAWPERLFAKTIVSLESGCWLWTTSVLPTNGYPIAYGPAELVAPGRSRYAGAHRWAYVVTYGPIPDGMEVDHLCRIPYCINPEHLELVDRTENMRRAREATAARKGRAA